jgi:hypothetical protein
MVSCVGIGTFTGAIFLMVLLFVAGDMDQITTSAAGPMLQIFIDATKNTAGAICLLMCVTCFPALYQWVHVPLTYSKAASRMLDSRHSQCDDDQQSHDFRLCSVCTLPRHDCSRKKT